MEITLRQWASETTSVLAGAEIDLNELSPDVLLYALKTDVQHRNEHGEFLFREYSGDFDSYVSHAIQERGFQLLKGVANQPLQSTHFEGRLFEPAEEEGPAPIPETFAISDEHSTAIFQVYKSQYARLTLSSVLNEASLIENQLLVDLVDEIGHAMGGSGYVWLQDSFVKPEDLVSFKVEQYTTQRGESVLFLFDREAGERSQEIGPSYVSGSGRLQSLQILSCYPTPCDMQALLQSLLARIQVAYYVLHRVFVDQVCAANRAVLSSTYDYFGGHLTACNKRNLIGRFWFIVANDDFVLYSFE